MARRVTVRPNGEVYVLALDSTSGEANGPWQYPTLINGWSNIGDPYDVIAYRHGRSGLEFKGHITGGASGTIAFYLDADYWPLKVLTTITDLSDDVGLGSARIYIYSSDGGVEITRIN